MLFRSYRFLSEIFNETIPRRKPAHSYDHESEEDLSVRRKDIIQLFEHLTSPDKPHKVRRK